jgi:hypothetical protein
MSEVVCPTNIKAERCATGQIESPVATLGYRLVQRKARGKNKERGESLRRRATSTQEYSRVSSSLRSISIAIVFCAGLKDRGHQLEMNLDPAADDEDPGQALVVITTCLALSESSTRTKFPFRRPVATTSQSFAI